MPSSRHTKQLLVGLYVECEQVVKGNTVLIYMLPHLVSWKCAMPFRPWIREKLSYFKKTQLLPSFGRVCSSIHQIRKIREEKTLPFPAFLLLKTIVLQSLLLKIVTLPHQNLCSFLLACVSNVISTSCPAFSNL